MAAGGGVGALTHARLYRIRMRDATRCGCQASHEAPGQGRHHHGLRRIAQSRGAPRLSGCCAAGQYLQYARRLNFLAIGQMLNFGRLSMIRSWLVCAPLVAFVACGHSEQRNENQALSQIEGFPFPIYVQETSDRVWRDVGIEALAIMGASDDDILLRAGSIVGTADGSSYILDYGDLLIKHFDATGRLVRTYGHGGGEGPGEFGNPMPVSVDADGNVIVPDSYQRSITRFGPGGEVLETFRSALGLSRMAITEDGRHYFMLEAHARDAHMFGTALGPDQPLHTFGTSDLERLGLGGEIVAVGSDVVYSPTYYGFIVRFSASGDVVYARETMDQVEPPTFETLEIMGGTAMRFKSRTPAKYSLAYSGGSLYLESRALSAGRDSTVVDVLAADDGSYRYSFEVPGRWRELDVAGNYLFALGDTLGTVFELRP